MPEKTAYEVAEETTKRDAVLGDFDKFAAANKALMSPEAEAMAFLMRAAIIKNEMPTMWEMGITLHAVNTRRKLEADGTIPKMSWALNPDALEKVDFS